MKKCLRCGEKNGDEYTYCGLCGALLPEIEAACLYGDGVDEKDENIAESPSEVSLYEMETFVGKNSGEIVKRFRILQQTGKRTSFNLAPFLMGLFFGLPGTALWFLYRKMVKPALIILATATLMNIVIWAVYFDKATAAFGGIIVATESLIRDPSGFTAYLSFVFSYIYIFAVYSAPLTTVKYLIGAGGITSLGFFAIPAYKKHSMGQILTAKSTAADKDGYIKALKNRGGTSVSYAVAGALGYIAVLLLPWLIYTVYLYLR